jgi:hypothetical protein
LVTSQPNSAQHQPAAAAQCTCGRAANSITISDEDKRLIEALRELKPIFPMLRDFARAAGSFGKLSNALADTLKK